MQQQSVSIVGMGELTCRGETPPLPVKYVFRIILKTFHKISVFIWYN